MSKLIKQPSKSRCHCLPGGFPTLFYCTILRAPVPVSDDDD